jgi:uncharacterized small protein (DUF1192 family)
MLCGISFLVSERLAKEARLNELERNTQSNESAAAIALLTAEIERLLEAELDVNTDQWSIELIAVELERKNLTAVVGELDEMVKGAEQTLAQLQRVEMASQSDSNRMISSANDSEKDRDDMYALHMVCMFFVMLIFAIQVFSAYSSRTASRGRVGAEGGAAKESSADDAEVERLRAEVERLRAKLQPDVSTAVTSVMRHHQRSLTNVPWRPRPPAPHLPARKPLQGHDGQHTKQ